MKRQAFAIIYAITALALLGALVALVGVGTRQRLIDDSREWREAQMRQLLLAGVELAAQGAPAGDVALPAELAADYSLNLKRVPGNVSLVVEARQGDVVESVDAGPQ